MPKQAVVTIPEEVEQELSLLKGFRDLVGEGIGYYLGARAVQSEASENTKDHRKTVATIRKNISTHLEEWIKGADVNSYSSKVSELKEARKVLSEAMKPFNEKKSPLTKAWKYCVNVAFPDSLKELDAPVSPRFSLSEWIEKTLANAKKKK